MNPAHPDAIRIVPLFVSSEVAVPAEATKAARTPHLTYRNGPMLTAAQVFTIFVGADWQHGTYAATAATLNQFFQFVLSSPLIDQLAEYSVPGRRIGHGTFAGSTVLTNTVAASITDAAIQRMLQQELSTGGSLPQPTSNTLFFVYLSPGVRVVQGGAASCQAFCGYHNDINGQIFYAVMPYPGCAGCTGGVSVLDALTSTSSHELCESITDPVPGTGWYDDVNGEIGDICAWKTKKLGQYTVQLEWSNAAGKCV